MPLSTRFRLLSRRLIATIILLVVTWLVLKFAIGAVTAIAWTVVAILALVAALWALRVLLR